MSSSMGSAETPGRGSASLWSSCGDDAHSWKPGRLEKSDKTSTLRADRGRCFVFLVCAFSARGTRLICYLDLTMVFRSPPARQQTAPLERNIAAKYITYASLAETPRSATTASMKSYASSSRSTAEYTVGVGMADGIASSAAAERPESPKGEVIAYHSGLEAVEASFHTCLSFQDPVVDL